MRRRHMVVSLLVAVAALAVFASSAAAACPCTIWPSTAVPKVANEPDGNAVELGVKFQSDLGGSITGIRFYKSAKNTGTHIGSLWSSAGSLLGSATFSGETASGWQQVDFGDPVGITANTKYVASYHTNVGHYANDDKFFATAGVDNPPLHALKNGTSGPNGVFKYNAKSVFPSTGSVSTNYWVDAVFSDAPGLTDRSPAASATNVPRTAAATATFSEPVQATTINFTLTDSTGNSVAGAASYDDTSRTARLNPTLPLAPNATYTARVSGAQDAAGNAMKPISWSFKTSADATAPTLTGRSPASNATGVDSTSKATATFSEAVQQSTIKFELKAPDGTAVPANMTYDSATRTATLAPSAPLASSTTYTAAVSGAQDAAGNTMSPVTWSFTTAAPSGVCPCSLWSDSDVPGTTAFPDGSAIELGVKIRSDEAGFIT